MPQRGCPAPKPVGPTPPHPRAYLQLGDGGLIVVLSWVHPRHKALASLHQHGPGVGAGLGSELGLGLGPELERYWGTIDQGLGPNLSVVWPLVRHREVQASRVYLAGPPGHIRAPSGYHIRALGAGLQGHH